MDLEHPLFELEPPFDACVVIDPFDEVLEYYESVWGNGPSADLPGSSGSDHRSCIFWHRLVEIPLL